MEGKFMLIFAALLMWAIVVDAGRRHNSNRAERRSRQRQRNREPEGARYSWTHDLGEGHIVEEIALIPTDTQQIYLRSTDDVLTAAGYAKSLSLYDFSTTTPRVSITLPERGRRSPCYVTDTTLTYQEVVDILAARNGTEAPLGAQVSLDGLSAPVQVSRRVCKTGKTVRTTVTPAGVVSSPDEIRLLTLDSVLTLRLPSASESASAGRGSRRGGGRTRGNRARNQANED